MPREDFDSGISGINHQSHGIGSIINEVNQEYLQTGNTFNTDLANQIVIDGGGGGGRVVGAWETGNGMKVEENTFGDNEDIHILPDGSGMLGLRLDKILYWPLSESYDVNSKGVSTSFTFTNPYNCPAMDIQDNGSSLYVVSKFDSSNNGAHVHEYSFGTPYDVTTLSFVKKQVINADTTDPFGVKWNADGSELIILDSQNNNMLTYTTTTNYDISTISLYHTYDLSNLVNTDLINGMEWKPDGSMAYVHNFTTDEILAWEPVRGPFDPTSGFYTNPNKTLPYGNDLAVSVNGFTFKDDGTSVYLANSNGIHEYLVARLAP